AEPRRTRFLWQQRCWRTSNAVEHLDRALTVPVDAALEQALERGWRHFPRVHSTAGFVVAGQRDGEEHALWTRDRNLVDLAVALARTAARRPERHDAALQIADLVLGRPERAGLFHAVFHRDPDSGREHWLPCDPAAPIECGFLLRDSATTALGLLELATVLPERAGPIHVQCE